MATPESKILEIESSLPKKVTRTGSWGERVIVFDRDSGNVDVRRKSDVENGPALQIYICKTKLTLRTGRLVVQKFELPKRRRNISLFVKKNDDAKITIEENRSADDRFFASLSFDHLGLINRVLFLLGSLSTLYISVASHSTVQ